MRIKIKGAFEHASVVEVTNAYVSDPLLSQDTHCRELTEGDCLICVPTIRGSSNEVIVFDCAKFDVEQKLDELLVHGYANFKNVRMFYYCFDDDE